MDAPDSPSRPVLRERRPTLPDIPSEASIAFVPLPIKTRSSSPSKGTSHVGGFTEAEILETPRTPESADQGDGTQRSSFLTESLHKESAAVLAPDQVEAVLSEKGVISQETRDLDEIAQSQSGSQNLADMPHDRRQSLTSANCLGEPEASLPSGFRSGQYASPARQQTAFSESEAEPLLDATVPLQRHNSQDTPSAGANTPSAGSRLLDRINSGFRAEMERIAAAITSKGMNSSEQHAASIAEPPASEPEDSRQRSKESTCADGPEVVKEAIILPPPAEQPQELQPEKAETADASSASAAATDGASKEMQAKVEPQGSTPNPRSPETEVGSAKSSSPKSAEKQAASAEEAQESIPPQGVTFAQTLSLTTMQASDRLAEKLIERLQQGCLEEASSGRHYYVFEASLPSSRSFSDLVARAFASRLLDLGFLRFEWWNGKDWREMPGRFCISHNPMYDKYSLIVRVRWPENLSAAQIADLDLEESAGFRNRGETQDNLAGDGSAANALIEDAIIAPILQQLQQTMALQQQLILQSAAALAAAEARAVRAEQRAFAAERTCLEELQKRGQSAGAALEAIGDVDEEVHDGGESASAAVADVPISATESDAPVSTAYADAAASLVVSTETPSDDAAKGGARVAGALQKDSARSARSVESSSDGEDCTEIDSKDLCGM